MGVWGRSPQRAGSRGRAPGQGVWSPEAENLFVFGRLIMQYFAVFIGFSADVTLSEIEITR